MRILTKRDVTNFISMLQKFERVRSIIYEYEKVFYHDVEDTYPTFRTRLFGFSIFEVYICLLAFKRFAISGKTDRFFEKKIKEILKKGALMKGSPVIEEAAGYFYDSYPDAKPDHDYKAPFYYLDAELTQTVTYEEFSQRLDYLYETVFMGCDDFVVDYSKYKH